MLNALNCGRVGLDISGWCWRMGRKGLYVPFLQTWMVMIQKSGISRCEPVSYQSELAGAS